MTEASPEDKKLTTCPRDWRRLQRRRGFGDEDGGYGIAITGLMNWRQWRSCQKRKMSPRSWQWKRRRRRIKHNRQRVRVNVSNGGGVSVFTVSVYWRQRQRRWKIKTGPRNQQRRQNRWQRKRNIRRVWRIGDNDGGGKDSGTTTEAVASRWWAWVIGDHNGSIGREIWAQGLDGNNGGVGKGRRRDDATERTSPTGKAAVCLRANGIDYNDGGISWKDRPEDSATMMEA